LTSEIVFSARDTSTGAPRRSPPSARVPRVRAGPARGCPEEADHRRAPPAGFLSRIARGLDSPRGAGRGLQHHRAACESRPRCA